MRPCLAATLARGLLAASAGGAAGCGQVSMEPTSEAAQYLEDTSFRRSVLEGDLVSRDNDYARERLSLYGVEGEGWDALEEADPPSRSLRVEDAEALSGGGTIEPGELTTLVPERVPQDEAAWVELGKRVFFEYPLRADPTYDVVAAIPGGLDDTGFLVEDGAYVGLRVVLGPGGAPRVGITCAMCHGGPDPDGGVSGALSNRAMDVGAARLLAMGLSPGELPPELDSTALADLDRLGPGRTDILPDAAFNPYALPDFGGLADMPYLHHTANWHHRSTATLAVRCETLFITSSGMTTRIPRVLAYAVASYFRSLPPAPPSASPSPESEEGRVIFEREGCGGCHTPPLYTSDRLVTLEEVGTDAAAGESSARHTGYYRIPSLRGVSRAAPYLHHGAVPTLEGMFDPARQEPGHRFGLELGEGERGALVAFLRTL